MHYFIFRYNIMKTIAIAGSPAQISKLRNGHRVRVSRAVEGEGFNLIVDPSKYDQISRSFAKGSASQIQLSPEEIHANMEAYKIGGEGIFAGGKLKMNKGLISGILKVATKTGTTLGKPLGKTAGINPFELGYDLGHDVIGPQVVHAFGKRTEEEWKRDEANKKKAQQAQAQTKATGGKVKMGKILKKVLPVATKIAINAAAKKGGLDPASTKELSKLGAEGTTAGLNEGGYGIKGCGKKSLMRRIGRKQIRSVTKELGKAAKSIIRDVIVPEGKEALREKIRSTRRQAEDSYEMPVAEMIDDDKYSYGGEGLYAGARGGSLLAPRSRMPEKSSIALGGSLMHMGNPAMRSDPYGANSHMWL